MSKIQIVYTISILVWDLLVFPEVPICLIDELHLAASSLFKALQSYEPRPIGNCWSWPQAKPELWNYFIGPKRGCVCRGPFLDQRRGPERGQLLLPVRHRALHAHVQEAERVVQNPALRQPLHLSGKDSLRGSLLFKTESELIKPVSPQAAQLGIFH